MILAQSNNFLCIMMSVVKEIIRQREKTERVLSSVNLYVSYHLSMSVSWETTKFWRSNEYRDDELRKIRARKIEEKSIIRNINKSRNVIDTIQFQFEKDGAL